MRSHTSTPKRLASATAIALALSIAGPVGADGPPAEAMDTETARSPAIEKLGRGVAGVVAGVLELPSQMLDETRENGVASGMTVGFAKGVGGVVTRSMVGVYQILTAPFEQPKGLNTAMAHAYPWGGIEAALRGDPIAGPTYLAEKEEELRWIRGIEISQVDGSLLVRFPSDLLFDFDSAQLDANAEPRLIGLAETLGKHDDLRVLVLGYTDTTGAPAYNAWLSEARARSVRDYLVSQGIPETRIEAAGFGEANPIASNGTATGRRSNRRVEFVLQTGDVAAR